MRKLANSELHRLNIEQFKKADDMLCKQLFDFY